MPSDTNKAHAKLMAMSFDERVAAVSDDVASRSDEYRSIDADELANLLGIDDTDNPGPDWERCDFVRRNTLEEIFEEWDEDHFFELLQEVLTTQRYEELRARTGSAKEDELLKIILLFLTDTEKQQVEDNEANRKAHELGTPECIASYTVKARTGKELTFEIYIGENGETCDLKTPYDERDGGFTDLSNCLVVAY